MMEAVGAWCAWVADQLDNMTAIMCWVSGSANGIQDFDASTHPGRRGLPVEEIQKARVEASLLGLRSACEVCAQQLQQREDLQYAHLAKALDTEHETVEMLHHQIRQQLYLSPTKTQLHQSPTKQCSSASALHPLSGIARLRGFAQSVSPPRRQHPTGPMLLPGTGLKRLHYLVRAVTSIHCFSRSHAILAWKHNLEQAKELGDGLFSGHRNVMQTLSSMRKDRDSASSTRERIRAEMRAMQCK